MKRTTPVLRRSCPHVEVSGVVITKGLPTMIIFVTPSRQNVRKLERFCHARNIGWKALAPGQYVCASGFDNLLDLTDRYWVKDWHWESNAHVCRASGAGEKPRPAPRPEVPDPDVADKMLAKWNQYLKDVADKTQERRKELAQNRPQRKLCWKRHGC